MKDEDAIPPCHVCGGELDITVTEDLGAIVYFTFRCKRCRVQGHGDICNVLKHEPVEST